LNIQSNPEIDTSIKISKASFEKLFSNGPNIDRVLNAISNEFAKIIEHEDNTQKYKDTFKV